jgi:hypothetical protein
LSIRTFVIQFYFGSGSAKAKSSGSDGSGIHKTGNKVIYLDLKVEVYPDGAAHLVGLGEEGAAVVVQLHRLAGGQHARPVNHLQK